MSMFKPEEIKERRNRDGSVSVFPIVGGRLRIAHETNDQLSITTELVAHAPLEGATMKAMVTTPKGLFSAYGVNRRRKMTQDRRRKLIQKMRSLAEYSTTTADTGLRF